MICKSCNRNINNSMNFCVYCGAQINKNAVRTKFTQKTEIDNALKEKDFNLIWKKIINEENVYAEYKYTEFFERVIKSIRSTEDFDKCTEKILHLAEQGYLYPKYLYGQAMIWAYADHGILSGSKASSGNQKKFNQGLNLVISVAEHGQPSAQACAGMIFKYGNYHQIKNPAKAYKYLKNSADKMHPQAMYEMGMCYLNGELELSKDESLAKQYFEKAAYFRVKNQIIEKTIIAFESSDSGNSTKTPLLGKYSGKFDFSKIEKGNLELSDEEKKKAEAIFEEMAYKKPTPNDKNTE